MEPYERLDKALDERRLALKMEWTEVAAAIEMTPRTLLNIRRGRHGIRDLNARRMDEWLDWEPGSVKALLAGGRPDSRGGAADAAGGQSPASDDPREVLAERIRSDPELAQAIALLAAQAIKPPPPDGEPNKTGETRAS